MQSSLHLFLVRSPSRQMECAHPSETIVAEDSFFLFERIRPMKKKEKREKGKEKGENAYSINRKARRTETSVCVCVEKHGWILHIGKKKRNGEVANFYGLVMKREKIGKCTTKAQKQSCYHWEGKPKKCQQFLHQ